MRAEAVAAQADAEAKDAHNGPINLLVSLLDEAVTEAEASAQQFREKTDASHYGYRRMSSEAARVVSAIDAALMRTTDVPSHLAMTALKEAIMKGRDDHVGFKTAGAVANEFAQYAAAMRDLRPSLLACRH